MKILVVVQARMGSSRLPGKVMLPVLGRPLLTRMIQRLRAARCSFELVVATTVEPADDPIRALCRQLGVACFSGHPTDCLERHYQAARELGADWVVKIPSDCPLIDPAAVDQLFTTVREQRDRYDFFTNLLPPSWPDGNDVEVMRFEALAEAQREARRPLEREHTTPFFWERPARFRIKNVPWWTGLDCSSSHRFTVDYREDYLLVRGVFERLYPAEGMRFSAWDIVELLEREPALRSLNAAHCGSSWQRRQLSELMTLRDRSGSLVWSGA